MALVRNPLISFRSSGCFANRITYTLTARGARAQKFSFPSGKASVPQAARRVLLSEVSALWSSLFDSSQNTIAWTRYARTKNKYSSAANQFIGAALSVLPGDPSPGMMFSAHAVGRVLVVQILDAFSGLASEEPGYFYVHRGLNASERGSMGPSVLYTSSLIGPVVPTAGSYAYSVDKATIPRSGIFLLDHTQAATYDQALSAGVSWAQMQAAGITWNDLI